jgi:Host cell surface-exposed lipoprotein
MSYHWAYLTAPRNARQVSALSVSTAPARSQVSRTATVPAVSARAVSATGEGFSRSSLIQQLTSSSGNGFTEAQAEYAVNEVMP